MFSCGVARSKILTFIFVLFTGGCATPHSFNVDAINNPDLEGHRSFVIVSSDASVHEDDLQYKEVKGFVKTALSGKGHYEAPSAEDAEMIVDIAYGIGEPQIDLKMVTQPVFTYEATDPSSTYVRRPSQQIVFEERVVPETKYDKFIRITARDNREREASEAPKQLWTIHVKIRDKDQDLRKYLPLLVAAATDHIGSDTEHNKKIKIKENDEVVAFVKKGSD